MGLLYMSYNKQREYTDFGCHNDQSRFCTMSFYCSLRDARNNHSNELLLRETNPDESLFTSYFRIYFGSRTTSRKDQFQKDKKYSCFDTDNSLEFQKPDYLNPEFRGLYRLRRQKSGPSSFSRLWSSKLVRIK